MSGTPPPPDVAQIVADLRALRERGLVRLRHAELPALREAAERAAVAATADGGSASVEALLRAAVGHLGGGSLGAAAEHTFGLGRGERDRPASVRRRSAALVYGVSVERFRKHHEHVVIEQVAEEILRLCAGPATPGPPAPAGPGVEFAPHVVLTGQAAGLPFRVVVHTEPVELLSGVDVVVVPQNVYLQMPQHFKSSMAAAVRRASARRNTDGEIIAEPVAEELLGWLHRNGRPGLPVAPGTVAATSSGEMAVLGIRRVYHAAVTTPRPGTNDYDVDPPVISQSARNALALARAERERFDPPLRSIGFPLLGAGRGGVPPQTSLSWLWGAIERDFAANGPWELHFINQHRAIAEVIVNGLASAGLSLAG